MTDAYESFADMFMGTLAGELSGLSREQVVSAAKAKYPVELEFQAHLQSIQAQAQAQVAAAQSAVEAAGGVLAVGYPIDSAPRTTH